MSLEARCRHHILSTPLCRVLDHHSNAFICKWVRSLCFGHTERCRVFLTGLTQERACYGMRIVWNICRLCKNSVPSNNMPCRATSWHATSRVVQENRLSSNRFTSIQDKTISSLPKVSGSFQSFSVLFQHPKTTQKTVAKNIKSCYTMLKLGINQRDIANIGSVK